MSSPRLARASMPTLPSREEVLATLQRVTTGAITRAEATAWAKPHEGRAADAEASHAVWLLAQSATTPDELAAQARGLAALPPVRPPTRADAVAVLAGTVAGTVPRRMAADWAARWFEDTDDYEAPDDETTDALDLLTGCDLMEDGRWMFPTSVLREWLTELESDGADAPDDADGVGSSRQGDEG